MKIINAIYLFLLFFLEIEASLISRIARLAPRNILKRATEQSKAGVFSKFSMGLGRRKFSSSSSCNARLLEESPASLLLANDICHRTALMEFYQTLGQTPLNFHKINDILVQNSLHRSISYSALENILPHAVYHGNYELVETLLFDYHVNPNVHEAAYFAIENNDVDIFMLFLENPDFDPNTGNLLNSAIKLGKPGIVKLLINDIRTYPTLNNNEALANAIRINDAEIFNCLTAHPHISVNSMSLIEAVKYQSLEVIEILLRDERVDPNFDRFAAFRNVFQHEDSLLNQKIIKLFTENSRFEPTLMDNILLKYATGTGNVRLLNVLLRLPSIDPSCDHNQPLGLAVFRNQLDVVKVLLHNDVVNRSRIPLNILMISIKNNNYEIIRLLLSHWSIAANPGLVQTLKETSLNCPKIKELIHDYILNRNETK